MNDPAPSTVDLDDPSACLCAALRRASRTMTNVYDGVLADSGLTGTQFTLLTKLTETGPVAIKTLAAAIGIDRTTLSRTLRPLAARGLIRERIGDDRRVKRISLTPKGTTALERARTAWHDAQRSTTSELGQAEAAELLARLAALERAAEAARRWLMRGPR